MAHFDPPLPDRGERGPPISFKRRTVDGVLWVLSTGAVARHAGKIRQLEFGDRALHALGQARRVRRASDPDIRRVKSFLTPNPRRTASF